MSRNTTFSLMLAISTGYLVLLVGWPVVYNFILSFQDVTIRNLGNFNRPFVGTAHYEALLANPLFPKVVSNTFFFVVGNVIVQFTLGLGVALLFHKKFPAAKYMRGLILAGWILPPMVVGALWKWMFATEFGVVNHLGVSTGAFAEKIYWLSDPSNALFAVTASNIWFGLPFNFILLLAGLSSIPEDLYEAAELDGAGPFARFWFVTLPLLKPTMLAVLCLGIVYTMRAFDLIWAMTKGGPVDSTLILPMWSYKLSFEFFRFGEGAAVASMSLIVVTVVALVYVRVIRSEYQA